MTSSVGSLNSTLSDSSGSSATSISLASPIPPEVLATLPLLDFGIEPETTEYSTATPDQRISARALHRLGYSNRQIASALRLTYHTVWKILHRSPRPRRERSAFVGFNFDQIRAFIEISTVTHRMNFQQIVEALRLPCSARTLRRFVGSSSCE